MQEAAARIGTRVQIVEVVNGRVELEGQQGIIVDMVRLAADLFGIECDTPRIQLDNGETIYGHECWWVEAGVPQEV
jgi:hypothetical protein